MHEVAASTTSTTGEPAVVNCSPVQPQARRVVFRLLCHASRVGGLIGKSGSIIKQLQQETSAKIHVDVSTPTSDHHRLIVVVASASVNKKIRLRASAVGEEQCNEEFEVSAGQEALVRVFERVIEVTAESNGVVLGTESVVSCRLLVKTSQVGGLMGKGGKVIDSIRRENGCRIKVFSADKLPVASPNDEIVEIEGDILAVKKALVAVSSRLQDCFPVERTGMTGNMLLELVSEQTLPAQQVDLPARRSTVSQSMTTSSVSNVSGFRPVSLDDDRLSNADSKIPLQEVVFKILCTNDKVGAIIGKGGSVIRGLENDSSASITIGPTVAECYERMITITAFENLDSQKSPAQTAVVLVFDRLLDTTGMNAGSKSLITVRLVVASNQVGCLLGKGGAIISEIRKETGTSIRIFSGDQAPRCVSDSDEVVQIAGEFVNVQDALRNVTGRLRENLLTSNVSNGAISKSSSLLASESSLSGRMKDPLGFHQSSSVSHGSDQHSFLTRSVDNLVISDHKDHHPSAGMWSLQKQPGVKQRGAYDVSNGFKSVKGGIELGCGSRTAIVTNTTVEIMVPENVIGSVYGENGSNLSRLRLISGASVTVHVPRPGTTNRIIVISGTPDETQAAQSLLQAFILTGSP